jgi:hypothetical protein
MKGNQLVGVLGLDRADLDDISIGEDSVKLVLGWITRHRPEVSA